MTNHRSAVTRRSVLAGLLASAAAPAMANAPSRSLVPPARPGSLADQAALAQTEAPRPRPTGSLADLLDRAGISGETALIALDAETGAVIEEHRADLRLPPASTAKALTTMYALHALGAEHRFVTRVESRGGTIRNGTLAGDLILRGGGDPTLQTEGLARLADELIERGLRRVEGRFVVDDSALPAIAAIDPDQPVSAGYNPALSGLNLNFNRVYFGWDVAGGQTHLSMDARSDREVPPVSVIDIRAAQRDLPVYTHDIRGGQEHWTVAASALGRTGSRWLPVRQPGVYSGDVFRALLAARGCHLPEARRATAPQGAVLAEVRSDPLSSVLREMLRFSTNITAECVGLAASLRQGGRPRGLHVSAEQMNAWLADRYGASGLALVDHSGLEDGSRLSPRAMATYLMAARREGILPNLLREHPMRSEDGQVLRNPPVEVHAKTGTLNFVSALAGYAQPRGGRPMVFSIISADMGARRRIRDDDSERPAGTRAWTGRARGLQQDLIERWAGLHG